MTNAPSSPASPAEPLISIIIPAYNAGPFIGATLASIQAQTYPHWEVLVVDDHSSDTTASVVQAMAAEDPRIRYLRPETPYRRPAGNRNLGLRHAQGQLVTFMDADDAYLPDGLAVLAQPLLDDPSLVASMAFPYYCDADLNPMHPSPHLQTLPDGGFALAPGYAFNWESVCQPNITLFVCCTMLTRTAVDALGFMDEALENCEDFKYLVGLLRLGEGRVRILPTCTYRYRNYAGSITKNPERLVRDFDSQRAVTDWLFDLPEIPENLRGLKGRHLSRRLCALTATVTKLGRRDLALWFIARSLAYRCITPPIWLNSFGRELVRALLPRTLQALCSRVLMRERFNYFQQATVSPA